MYFSSDGKTSTINLKLKRGRSLQIFVNHETEIIVCDLIAAHDKGGNEFIRKNFSKIKTPTEKECESDEPTD